MENQDVTEVKEVPVEEQVKIEGSRVVTFAETYQITDTPSLVGADKWFQDWAAKEKERFFKFDPGRKKAYEAYVWALALLKEATEPYAKARKILGEKISAERGRLERLRLAEEARLNAIAQEEAMAAKQAEADAALAEAEKLERAGDKEQAEAMLQEAEKIVSAPTRAPAIIVASSLPEMNSNSRKLWKWKIEDEAKIKDEYFVPRHLDEAAIDSVVRSKGKDAERIVGGIFAWQEEITVKGR